MSDIKEITKKDGTRAVYIKGGQIDIPKPYTIILKTIVRNEFEIVALTKQQYEIILAEVEKGASGIILNGEYHDRYSIYKIKKSKKQ